MIHSVSVFMVLIMFVCFSSNSGFYFCHYFVGILKLKGDGGVKSKALHVLLAQKKVCSSSTKNNKK